MQPRRKPLLTQTRRRRKVVNMSSRRVVVTGIGVISALGNNRQQFEKAVFSGESGIKRLNIPEIDRLRFKKGAQVSNFQPPDHFEERHLMLLERFTQFALIAAREAVEDSKFQFSNDKERRRTSVITGTGAGGQTEQDQVYKDLYKLDKNRLHPLTVPRVMSNAPTSHISMELGITGPSFAITTACSSSSHAIGQAFWAIRSGMVDRAIAGGSETPFGFANLKAWEGMRVVSNDECRPFSKDRTGMILGEGGAMLLLETEESALMRGAEIYAEIAGCGMSADAFHITQPSEIGAANAMNDALEDAGIAPEAVGYINAHGTATLANDVMEANAIRNVFGKHTDKIPVSSTKAMHGHTLGAAGAIEAVATILALKNQVIPANINFSELDPNCRLNIADKPIDHDFEAAMSNSFAFGGLNGVLIFKRRK